MKFALKINEAKSISEISDYWTNDDFMNLLEELDFEDARNSDPAELRALLEMALSDLEPHEAAEALLKYKLKDKLNAGQIQNISHEMLEENESEGNADMSLHYALFNINQLLYGAFNGTFQKAKATKIEFELSFDETLSKPLSKEIALKAVCSGLTSDSPIRRLFGDQLIGKDPFTDANKIVWELHDFGDNKYTIITSDYWINKEDFEEFEVSGVIKFHDEGEE